MTTWRDTGNMTAAQMLDIPPVWLAGCLALAWAQARFLPMFSAEFDLARLVGAGLIVLGVGLMLWTVAVFRLHQTSVVPHQTPQHIITTGPFARSRNPIYLGDVLVLTGAVLWWGAWLSLMVIPLFVWILTRRFIAPEEARMKQSFGPDFTAFAQKTPRWF